MQERHYLENSLRDAIEQQELIPVQSLVTLIQQSHGANLTSIDKHNKSFLSLALEKPNNKIAHVLFENLKNSEKIIFRLDGQGRSLIWHAAKNGHIEIIKQIF